jgi:hypothetical protein
MRFVVVTRSIFIFVITGDRKVFGQNVCSLLTRLEVFPMNQKLSVRTRILCSFRIWVQKFLLYSLVKSNEIIFEKPKKLVLGQNLFHTFLFVFGLLESNSNKPKAIDCGQNFVLFPNMSLDMLCLFLFKSSERFFEKPEKLSLIVKNQFIVYVF